MLRWVVDSTVWVASVRASATPTAAVAPVASPWAVVVAEAVIIAFASSLPVSVSSVPAPMSAELVTFEIAIEIDGTTVTPPPAAPVFASVVIACRPSASSVRSCALVSRPVSSIPAKVVSLTIESANEMPRPKLEPPVVPPGSALTVEMLLEAALRETSPPVASTEAPLRIAAVVLTVTRLIETEPATPTLPPPAPEAVSAPKRLVVSPATFVSKAEAVNPCATTTAPVSTADSLVTLARLIATPAPMLTPEPVVDALPSPFAFESLFAELFSVRRPPAVR